MLKNHEYLSDKLNIRVERGYRRYFMNKIQMNGVNLNTNVSNAKKAQELKPQEEAKPQLKEHCSSKAGQALKNVALGVMLAASVIAGAKATTVPVKANETQQPLDNSTSISQQAETSAAPQTEVEAAVDEMINNHAGKPSKLHVGGKLSCSGSMRDSFSIIDKRSYDAAEITKGGNLVFYNKITSSDGDSTHYLPVNSFDLKASTNGDSIVLQTGSRFEEATKLHGDYIELADDGVTFNVYNADGEKLGHVKAQTPETHDVTVIIEGVTVASVVGLAVAKKIKDSH